MQKALSSQVALLTAHLTPQGSAAQSAQQISPAPPLVSPPHRESYAPDPEPFAGDLVNCRGFLLQYSVVFNQRPLTFSSDQSKVHYIMGLLRGRALAWAEALNSHQSVASLTYDAFVEKMKGVSDHPDHCGNAAKHLLNLRGLKCGRLFCGV